MPIPELELARVKRALDRFCDRIPLHVRPELTNLYRFKGNSVVLIERRPYFRDRTRHTEHEFAKFVYNQRQLVAGPCAGAIGTGLARLRWVPEGAPSSRRAAEVASDPTGIFLG